MSTDIPAVITGTNADLILAAHELGYIPSNAAVLDPTYGRGVFWQRYRPPYLIANDITTTGVDFRDMPYVEESFGVVVFDPPYRLNGTPDLEGFDERYGIDVPRTVEERMGLIFEGLEECAAVLAAGGFLLVKCQDQVVSGAVRWQSIEIINFARGLGLYLVDMLLLLRPVRPQPPGRSQQHARRNYSTLLVFEKETTTGRKRRGNLPDVQVLAHEDDAQPEEAPSGGGVPAAAPEA